MTTKDLFSANPSMQNWRGLYTAALCEKDSRKVLNRVVEVEDVLIQRARELLLTSGDNIEEEQAIDDALYVLRALRSSFERENDRNGRTRLRHPPRVRDLDARAAVAPNDEASQ